MRFRGVLLVLFLLPPAWGLITLVRGPATPVAPRCPGLQLDKEGEENPGRMRPGFTCVISYDTATGRSTGTRTYDQQRYAQQTDRNNHFQRGIGYVAYGAAGLAPVTVAAPAGMRARTVFPTSARRNQSKSSARLPEM
jgi:hypothetical protein